MMINKENATVAPPLVKFNDYVVDVRDVARMHIAAMENDESIGKRMILAENTYWVKEFCAMLNELGHKAPTFTPPVFLVKFMANFDKTIKPVLDILVLCLDGLDFSFQYESCIQNNLNHPMNYDPIPIGLKTIKDTSDFLESYEQA